MEPISCVAGANGGGFVMGFIFLRLSLWLILIRGLLFWTDVEVVALTLPVLIMVFGPFDLIFFCTCVGQSDFRIIL